VIKTVRVFLVLTLLGGAVSAHALSWSEIEKKALESNPEIKSYQSRVESFDYQRKVAYSDYWPQFNLIADETRKDGNDSFATFNAVAGTIDLHSRKKFVTIDSYGFKSTMNLFKGFSTEANVDFNSAELDAARSQYSLKSIDLRYSLRTAYIEYLMAKKSVKTSQKIIDQQKRNRDLIKIKYDTGLEAAWALDQANVALQLAQLKLESDNETLRQAGERINVLLDSPVQITDSEENLSFENLPDLGNSALENHPEIIYQEQQKRQAQAQRKLARAEFYPSLDASYSWINSKEKSAEEGEDQNTVSLTLTWNIFDGFASRNRLKAAAAQEMSAELSERALREQLTLDLQQQRRTYELNLKTVLLKKAELKAAVSRSETVSSQYRNGLRKYQDWESAELRLIDLEREMVEVEKQTLLQRAAWEKTAGIKLGDI
jgi:outer membrane protein TolC